MGWDQFIGNRHAVDILRRAVAREQLPHAMIFAGPAGVGKRTLALLLAQALNCPRARDGEPCDQCPACLRIRAYRESWHRKCVKGSTCGVCPVCQARNRRHPDIRMVEPGKIAIENGETWAPPAAAQDSKPAGIISIAQIRDIIEEVAFQPLEARYRVVILDPADQMKVEAQNSLLKTLEEPPSRTVIILIATSPYQLLETIRSRARVLYLGAIPREELADYLIRQEGKEAADAQLAAALSGGSLGTALALDMEEYRATREAALAFVTLLLNRSSFAEISAISAGVAKDKDAFPAWIEMVARLLEDIYYVGPAPERVGQRDILSRLETLGQKTPHPRLLAAIAGVRRLQSDLSFSINRQIALEALFLELSSQV